MAGDDVQLRGTGGAGATKPSVAAHPSDGGSGPHGADFIAELRFRNVIPHVAQNTTNRRSAIDGRTARRGS